MSVSVGKRFVFLLCLLYLLYVVSTIIFSKGFLLKRSVLKHNSSCVVDFTLPSENHGEKGCWVHKKFDKAIIVLIDALRYDFLTYNTSQGVSHLPFQNKLKTVHTLLTHHPLKSCLYKFIADPPTTTLQRLKGLTTGSLPTFVEAGANFDTPEINEDNIIDQFLKNGKKIKFLGDDTWMGLFPNRFHRSFPFPSFNVKDIHTVDNGILRELIPEMKKPDWNVLVAHFLGVDHVGHRFGPYHQAMAEKLEQMDDMIRNVTLRMDKDTILFLMGDHGMTKTGDHGGDSADEVEAGLFVYSSSQMLSSSQKRDSNDERVISQIDFVPTLSLLMGIPVPFSNIGMIVPELFNYCSWWKTEGSELKQMFHEIEALRVNALQISNYVKTYSEFTGEFHSESIDDLQDLLDNTESHVQHLVSKMVQQGESGEMVSILKELKENYIIYIFGVRKMFEENWAKFDMVSVGIGIFLFFNTLILNIYLWQTQLSVSFSPSIYVAFISSIVAFLCGLAQIYIFENKLMPFMAFFVVLASGVVNCIILTNSISESSSQQNRKSQTSFVNSLIKSNKQSLKNILVKCVNLESLALLICVIHTMSFFSNSLVVNEDSLTLFSSQTLILLTLYKVLNNYHKSEKDCRNRGKSHKFDIMRYFTDKSFILIFGATTSMMLLRVSALFRVCREEQWNCELSVFVQPLTSLTVVGHRNQRYFFSVACMGLFYAFVRRWLSKNGNLSGDSVLMICFKYLFPVLCTCCCLYWALLGLPVSILDTLPSWQHIILPWIIYISVFIIVTICIINPLFICYISQNTDEINLEYSHRDSKLIIPQVYKHLKKKLQEKDEGKPPLMFGLLTVYSSSIIVLIYSIFIVLFLLLGDGLSPGLIATCVALFFYLEIYSQLFSNSDFKSKEPFSVPWSAIITFGCLMSLCFYQTGHQATLSSIHWVASFTGFHGDFKVTMYFIPALLISLHTFASHVAFSLGLPLLLLWPYYKSHKQRKSGETSQEEEETKGEFTLFENENVFKESLFRLCIKWIFFTSLKLFGSITAAALHRRHLMVWKVFATRFVFEATGSFIIFIVTLLIFLYVLRIDNKLSKFFQKLET